MQIHEKIRQARLSRRLTEGEVSRKIGVGRTTYQYWEKSTPDIDKVIRVSNVLNVPIDDFIKMSAEDFVTKYPIDSNEVSVENLIEHNHENLNDSGKALTYTEKRRDLKNIETPPTIPFYDVEAIAGTEYGADMNAITHPTGQVDIGDFLRDSAAALRVYGNSMIPNYPPGCVVGMTENTDEIIHPGHVYVIETGKNRYIKRLYYNKDQTGFICVSDNVNKFSEGPMTGEYFYPPFEIPMAKIKKLYDVTGVIKRNINTVIMRNDA